MAQLGQDPRWRQVVRLPGPALRHQRPVRPVHRGPQSTAGRDVAAQISTPLLITDPQDEQFWPGQSDQLAALLTASHEVVSFTRQDGANFHCEPLARRLTSYRIFEWLTRHLDRPTRPDRSLPKHDRREPDDGHRQLRRPGRKLSRGGGSTRRCVPRPAAPGWSGLVDPSPSSCWTSPAAASTRPISGEPGRRASGSAPVRPRPAGQCGGPSGGLTASSSS